jgi:hypothetical protein
VIALIEAIFRLRVPADADPARGPVALNELRESTGAYWLGDNYTKEIGAYPSFPGKSELSRTSFLPSAELAALWMGSGAPLPATIHVDNGACVTCYAQPAGEPPGAGNTPDAGGGGGMSPSRGHGCRYGSQSAGGGSLLLVVLAGILRRWTRRKRGCLGSVERN